MGDLDHIYNAGNRSRNSFVREAVKAGVSPAEAEAYYSEIHKLEMIGIAAERSGANTAASIVLWLAILLFVAGLCYGMYAALWACGFLPRVAELIANMP